MGCCNNGWGGGGCLWIIVLIIILCCCCGNSGGCGNSCGCGNGCGCGNNCGGCGYAGCDAMAKAIANGEAPVNGCPVGGDAVAAKIARIMGQEAGESIRRVAFVKCGGTCDKAKESCHYYGVHDCEMMDFIPGGGPKTCHYGCIGDGTCEKVCSFDAIHVINGVAVVDKEKCRACGACVEHCPRHLIELVPYESRYLVRCASKDKGKLVMQACEAGCIGCKKCQRECPSGAVTVENNIAHIDTSKCTNCGTCASLCPRKGFTGPVARKES